MTARLAVPREAGLLHDVGGGHVVAPHVVLPLLQPDHAAQHVAGVDPDPHVHLHVTCHTCHVARAHLHTRHAPHRPDGRDHGETHPEDNVTQCHVSRYVHQCPPDDVDGVVGAGHGEARHAVVAVAQDLDAKTLVVAGQLVELAAQGTVTIWHTADM